MCDEKPEYVEVVLSLRVTLLEPERKIVQRLCKLDPSIDPSQL